MSEQATILVVDDDETILGSVVDILALSDYVCLTAVDGAEALQVMYRRTPDLILSDITMQTMDGYEFYRAVRSNPDWVAIPFIFLTARGQAADIRRGTSLGADHYLVKPFETEDLLTAVQARLQRMRDIQAAAQTEVEQMKEQLMKVFGHELRTPLTHIYGYVDMLQEDLADLDEEEVSTALQAIRGGSERLVKLIEDLMLVVHIDSGAVEMEITRYRTRSELAPLAVEVVRDHSVDAEKRSVQIELQIPDGVIVFGMPAYLKDALARLINNAIKFSKPEGGRVVISGENQDGQTRIAISDNGIGIEAAKQKQLFKRFAQIDRDKMEQQGIGLGLAISSSLVRLHNGDMRVESQPDKGSVFTITLPMKTD
jgi:signal transduction histidine kinase